MKLREYFLSTKKTKITTLFNNFFSAVSVFINNFLLFSHTTQHNIQNTTKQNNRHILNISRSNQKGGGEGRTTRTQKSLLYTVTYVKQKTCQASMVEGLAPPTRAVVHSHYTICRRLRIQYVFLHMCGVNQFWIIVFFTAVKPANNILFCIELIAVSVFDVHSWEYHDICVWCCWRRTQMHCGLFASRRMHTHWMGVEDWHGREEIVEY